MDDVGDEPVEVNARFFGHDGAPDASPPTATERRPDRAAVGLTTALACWENSGYKVALVVDRQAQRDRAARQAAVSEALRMRLIQRGEEGETLGGSIMVETDLFEHREVKPHFINPCCFGEDFAAWLKQELSRFTDLGFELSEAIQEDYGWGFWASRGKDRFWVALSYVGDGPQEAPAQWVISVTYDPGLNLAERLFHTPDRQALEQLRERVRQILTSNSSIKTIKA